MIIPAPSPRFIARQKRLTEILSKPLGIGESSETLRRQLRGEFCRAFGLKLSARAGNHLFDFTREFENGQEIFKNCEAFRDQAGNLVLVAQPWYPDEAYLAELARTFGGRLAFADQWSFEYPGETRLFLLALPAGISPADAVLRHQWEARPPLSLRETCA